MICTDNASLAPETVLKNARAGFRMNLGLHVLLGVLSILAVSAFSDHNSGWSSATTGVGVLISVPSLVYVIAKFDALAEVEWGRFGMLSLMLSVLYILFILANCVLETFYASDGFGKMFLLLMLGDMLALHQWCNSFSCCNRLQLLNNLDLLDPH